MALLVVLTLAAPSAPAQATDATASITQDRNELLSDLQKMSHGYYSDAEWQAVYDRIHRLLDRAEQAQDMEEVIYITLLLARVQSDMRGLHTDALYTLSKLKDRFADSRGLPMGRIYAGLAEVHAKLGNRQAIEQLIEEFRSGPHYDPSDYDVKGGERPDSDVTWVRPDAEGDPSITVTIMQRHLRQASMASGEAFPSFQLTTRDGRTVSKEHYAGKILLVDFYAPQWPAWAANLPYLKRLHEKYRAQGFEILGISLDPNAARVDEMLAREGLSWPQVVGDLTLRRQCGVLGEPRSFLVNGEGQIVARNPTIPQLEDLLADLLGP